MGGLFTPKGYNEHTHTSYLGVLSPRALLWPTPCAYLTKFSHDYSDRIRQDIPAKHLNFLLERRTEQQSYRKDCDKTVHASYTTEGMIVKNWSLQSQNRRGTQWRIGKRDFV